MGPQGTIEVAICLDEKVVVPAAVLISSIARNASPARNVRVHVLTTVDGSTFREIAGAQPPNVEIAVYEADSCFGHLPDKDYISKATYLRFLLPKLLPIPKVLYLDVDIIVQRELSDLFDLDVADVSLAAVSDSSLQIGSLFWDDFSVAYRGLRLPFADYATRVLGLERGGSQYFNAGVLLINLDHWRRHDVAEKALRFLVDHLTLEYLDQDALSAITQGRYIRLDPRWNAMANCVGIPDRRLTVLMSKKGRDWERIRRIWKDDPWIIHYAGPSKPWTPGNTVTHADVWWRYAMNSPVKDTLGQGPFASERNRQNAVHHSHA